MVASVELVGRVGLSGHWRLANESYCKVLRADVELVDRPSRPFRSTSAAGFFWLKGEQGVPRALSHAERLV